MSLKVPQDDQRTIKRYYRENIQNQINKKQQFSLSNIDLNIKKPLKDLFQSHLTQRLYNEKYVHNKYDSIDSVSQCLKDNYLKCYENSGKFTEKIIQPIHDVSKYSMRLFTFMESTQNDKVNYQNKENLLPQNFQVIKMENQKLSKLPNPRNSIIMSLKKTSLKHALKSISPQFQKKQKSLISFIENSRKKRQQLLMQLEKFDLDKLSSNFENDKQSYLTARQQRHPKPKSPNIKRPQSSRTSLKTQNFKGNFFKTLIDKQIKINTNISQKSLKKKRVSLINLKKDRQNISPQTQKNYRSKSARSNLKHHQDVMTKQSTKSIKSFKTNLNDFQNNKKFKLSLQKKKFNKTKFPQKVNEPVNIDKLLIKKKQLQKQLVNINDEIIFFNKKKKKQCKRRN